MPDSDLVVQSYCDLTNLSYEEFICYLQFHCDITPLFKVIIWNQKGRL